MSAQLSAGGVSLPTTWQSSSPFTWGWDDMPEPARHIPGPRFVSRELVHKTAAERVLLTDGIRHALDGFIIAAMLPRDHCLYHQDDSGWTDPMLPTEALRQAGYYIQHRFYGVPETHKFILSAVTLGIDDTAPPTPTPWLPVNLRVTCAPTAKWTYRRLCMRLEVEFSVAGVVCGHGSLLSQALDPRVYQAIRGPKVARRPRDGALRRREPGRARARRPGHRHQAEGRPQHAGLRPRHPHLPRSRAGSAPITVIFGVDLPPGSSSAGPGTCRTAAREE
ncbi:hypothetical protein N5079_14830 [Planotetraspora sp. A-T 1434]|uniref:AfsA-related hotdog domain-containing protein n=1 Tax=Planotetraspora sp. A-T 1434 TaxID=2979219 RepID=UPI0021BE7B99|nr:AfsA-related hotdog domain-containing protein [Planotetraspora sp. A-T 1434]MCT9931493.1 hypothetical protein [Planotetraspora sp. A-T 1434]